MKTVAVVIFSLFLLSGCSKKDIKHWFGKSRCEVVEQTSTYNPKPGVEAKRTLLKKTLYPNGMVKTMSIVTNGDVMFTIYDSLQYTFEYGTNSANVHLRAVHPYGVLVDEFDFTVSFDPATGYATRVGDEIVKYANKKITEFGTRKLEYDGAGNLIAVWKAADGTGVRYEYDLTKKSGKNELYAAPDNNNLLGVRYCLAEAMGWMPPQSTNRRIKEIYQSGGDPSYTLKEYIFSEHKYSSDGKLIEFNLIIPEGPSSRIENKWKCNSF